MNWYYSHNDEKVGPLDLDALKGLVASGALTMDSMVSNETMGEQWCRVGDVPELAGPKPVHEVTEKDREFARQLAEQIRLEAAEKKVALFRGIMAAVVVALVIAGVAVFAGNKPKRDLGISSSCPIGTLSALDARLITRYQMEKETITECAEIKKPAAVIFRYSNPKCPRGDNVSARGTITALVDGKGNLQALLCAFPSPGQHGFLLVNRSIVSIFANELWEMYGGSDDVVFQSSTNVLSGLGDSCGLVSLPPDGVSRTLDKKRMRCIWTEYGINTVSTMVHFEKK